jgi:hypothetical protein
MMKSTNDENEVELSNFQLDYRSVSSGANRQQHGGQHSWEVEEDGMFLRSSSPPRRRNGGGQKTRWLLGVVVAALVMLMIGVLSLSSFSSKQKEGASDAGDTATYDDGEASTSDNGDSAIPSTDTTSSNNNNKRIRHEVAKLLPRDETDRGHFGLMILLPDENTAYIAAPSSSLTTPPDERGNVTIIDQYVGSIYAYDINSGTLLEEVPSPTLAEHAWYGGAMAVSSSSLGGDSSLFVTAQGLNTVFEYTMNDKNAGVTDDDQLLTLQSTLVSNVTTSEDEGQPNATTIIVNSFGSAVAYDGDYLIVGDSFGGGGDANTAAGRIHVYRRRRDGGNNDDANTNAEDGMDGSTKTWTKVQTIAPPDPQHGEMFGAVLTYRGDTLIVGSFLQTTVSGGERSGCVYIYQQDSAMGTFARIQTLVAADGGAEHEGFGASVALSDTILVVGLNDREGRTIESLNGGAFVYRRYDDNDGSRTTTTWKFESLLLAHDQAIVKGQFGGGVAVYDETIVVGSAEMDEHRSGKVYVFRKNAVSAKWEDIAELAPSDPSEGHHFGRIVAIYNNTVVVGAFMDNELQNAGGSAYIFHLDN